MLGRQIRNISRSFLVFLIATSGARAEDGHADAAAASNAESVQTTTQAAPSPPADATSSAGPALIVADEMTCEQKVTADSPNKFALEINLPIKDTDSFTPSQQNNFFAWMVGRTGSALKVPSAVSISQKSKIELNFPVAVKGELIFIEATYVVHRSKRIFIDEKEYTSPAQAVIDELTLISPTGERYPIAKEYLSGSRDQIRVEKVSEGENEVTLSKLFGRDEDLDEAVTKIEIPKFIRGKEVLNKYFSFMRDFFRQDGIFWSNQFLHELGALNHIKSYSDLKWAWRRIKLKNGAYWFSRTLSYRVPWLLTAGIVGLGTLVWHNLYYRYDTPLPRIFPEEQIEKIVRTTNRILHIQKEKLNYQGHTYSFEVSLNQDFRVLLAILSRDFPKLDMGASVQLESENGETLQGTYDGHGNILLEMPRAQHAHDASGAAPVMPVTELSPPPAPKADTPQAP